MNADCGSWRGGVSAASPGLQPLGWDYGILPIFKRLTECSCVSCSWVLLMHSGFDI